MSGRLFGHAFAWQMTATQLASAAALLAGAATDRLGPVSLVVGIERGGVAPARIIAGQLGVPLRFVRARHNTTSDLYVPATGQVSCTASGISPPEATGSVLVVDDICGTGATLHAVTTVLRGLGGPGARLHTATLCRNAGASARPGLTVWDDLREWVIFPWEPGPPADTAVQTLPDPGEVRVA